MEMLRNRTKEIRIGNVWIGGSHPVAIQSMTNTKTEDVAATVGQILALEAAGCEIIRCAVPTMEAALALKEIKKQIHIPLVADIHFDYRLAIAAIENGRRTRSFKRRNPRRTLCRQRGSGCAGAHPCIRSFLPDRTDHWPGRRLYLIWKYVIKEFSLC